MSSLEPGYGYPLQVTNLDFQNIKTKKPTNNQPSAIILVFGNNPDTKVVGNKF